MTDAARAPAPKPPLPPVIPPLLATYPELGFALVPVPTGSKGPVLPGWQTLAVTTPEQVARWWRAAPAGNIGLLHAPSRTAALDVDHPEHATRALEGVGIDLPGLLAAPGAKVRTAKGLKPIYQVAEDFGLARKALTWPHPETGRPFTVFELRAGACQDLLPPSTHPETGQPYTWHPAPPQARSDLPALPKALLRLWQGWSELKPLLEAACPWSSPPKARPGPDGSVIGSFNERFTVSGCSSATATSGRAGATSPRRAPAGCPASPWSATKAGASASIPTTLPTRSPTATPTTPSACTACSSTGAM